MSDRSMFRYYENEKQWHNNNKLHRINGPARIIDIKAHITVEYYYDGQLHRNDGPAIIRYYDGYNADDRHVEFEQWYKHGQLHRDDGPA